LFQTGIQVFIPMGHPFIAQGLTAYTRKSNNKFTIFDFSVFQAEANYKMTVIPTSPLSQPADMAPEK
jgi:hypothetical protein